MAKVTLIDHTGKGRPDEEWHAADLLIFTKQTRLEMTSGLLADVKAWPREKKQAELEYMAGTIPSSWEMVDVMFLIEGLSRATAQQVTRTRTASYAMQSQRVNDASGFGVVNPHEEGTDLHEQFAFLASEVMVIYKEHSDAGATNQDARGLLPMNVECSLVAKYNLRSFVDLMRARSSLRAQGEYVDIADVMRQQLLEVWPWAAPFFVHPMDAAIKMLEAVAKDLTITTGKGHAWEIAKAIDLLRKS